MALPAVLLALFLGTRLPALGRFVTADEALWLRSSANFFYAIKQGDWEGTAISAHPGVSTMWAGAAGFQLVFPEYERLGEREISDFALRHLLLRRGINPIEVLAAGRAVSVLINALAFIAIWPFARKVLGKWGAFGGMALLALDPFLIGQQRLLHQDGLLTAFMLLSLFAFLFYWQKDSLGALIVSGAASGLAGLTKTPGWFLTPVIFGVMAWRALREIGEVRLGTRALLIWSVAALAVVVALYPAMWQGAIEASQNMLTYALASAEGVYSGPAFFGGEIHTDGDLGSRGWIFYPVSALWRSTPLTLLGLLMSGDAIWRARRDGKSLQALGIVLLFVLAFSVLMSLGTKKFDRYYLPAMGGLMMIAGWGLTEVAARVWRGDWRRTGALVLGGLLLAGIFLQVGGVINSAPYYITYFNPLLGGPTKAFNHVQMGWGEGMEGAAQFLMRQPDIEEKRVAAWYSTSFNLLFEHDAAHIPITPNLLAADLEALLAYDYLVTYLHQWQRGTPANLLDVLEGLEPTFVMEVDGLDYARVYQP